MEYQEINVEELKPFEMRSIRQSVVDKLKERIENGFNPARPLSVVRNNGKYLTADGNHRLVVLKALNIESVPCVIYDEADPYSLAIKCNQDEDTYAPMDLFDWLEVIGKLREDGLTQAKIGGRIGWSRDKVKDHIEVIDKIGANVLDFAKQHQEGRAPKKGATAPFNFTEGWFRNSGLYELCPEYQERLINDFITDKYSWRNEKVKREAAKYKLWQELKLIAQDELASADDIDAVFDMIENHTFKSTQQLRAKIESLNKAAANKLICGDCVKELNNLDDASIDVIITDPPYGIDYSSNRSKYAQHVTKNKIENDVEIDGTLALLDDVCESLCQKTKNDAHLYFFTSWKVYPEFVSIIKNYFEIKNMIVWDKGNHGSGDLKGTWGNKHELIIFATKGHKPLNNRKSDILSFSKVNSQNAIHPTQKPIDLIIEILSVSAQKADTVCDPFMGSGSTIKAVKNYGGLSYVGIEIDRIVFDKAKAFIG